MNKNVVINAVERNIQTVELTRTQKMGVAKEIRNQMWPWHPRAAALMVLCIAIRLIYMARQGIRFPSPLDSKRSARERMQGSLYVLFYLFVIVQILTGMYLEHIGGSLKGPLEAIHKLAIVWFPLFVLLHVGGIVLAELSDKKGITSKMIGGD